MTTIALILASTLILLALALFLTVGVDIELDLYERIRKMRRNR